MGQEVDNLGESVQDPGGEVVQPSTTVSPEPEVQPTSLEADDKLEAALKRIDDLEGQYRGLQGDKDRGTNKALEGVKDLKERFNGFEKYAELRKDGKSADEAQREMVIAEMVEERMGTQVAQEPVGSQAVEPSGFDADKFLREQGIDPNSAEALELIRKDTTGVVDYFNLALGKKTSPVVEPNVGQVMPTGTGGVAAPPDVAELTARLQELQKEPNKHLEERRQLMEELAKLTPRK